MRNQELICVHWLDIANFPRNRQSLGGFVVYFRIIQSVFLCAFASLIVAGCQTTAAVKSPQQFQISQVKVLKAKADVGTVNLAEDVRYKTLRQARRYSEVGQEKVMEVTLMNLHLKNPFMSVMVGDQNHMSANTRIFDKATGNLVATFNTTVANKRALNGISGAIIAAAQNPIDVEQDLATLISEKILVQAYGSAYAKSVRDRPVSAAIKPNYPKNYEALKREFICASKRQSGFSDGSDEGAPVTFEVPKECKVVASAR
ncbi:MAG: hypothetical protein MPJ78_02385 [Hyphomicrobiaceae bacterium]|nr:hypothetical protein [Hyphomicrobiaceae bacterium]